MPCFHLQGALRCKEINSSFSWARLVAAWGSETRGWHHRDTAGACLQAWAAVRGNRQEGRDTPESTAALGRLPLQLPVGTAGVELVPVHLLLLRHLIATQKPGQTPLSQPSLCQHPKNGLGHGQPGFETQSKQLSTPWHDTCSRWSQELSPGVPAAPGLCPWSRWDKLLACPCHWLAAGIVAPDIRFISSGAAGFNSLHFGIK